ncbi:MAG: molybdopterin-dependent oxidoreductase [Ignavibacteriae bacterium]|nr:molybdopterin-dependent oxidoreductase [Ignavibacteria bacterium]MBI3365441.1 molybdopterin-dependent oxidoreductase [Ignavibacteriota bacterium]
MAKITIDGKQFEADSKLTIIQAALEQGIEIPHFCWHPRLSIAGNCRICLVEVEKLPKLVIACSTQVADGMVVKTNSEKVVNGREAVMEFLLINHPLDCPICDEAGECKLQDYAYKLSEGVSRFEFDKIRKPKRVELGPNVMLDTERCIMCSRCVRFCDEIAKKPQLTFIQRADHIELTTFPGEKLDNPYSMNTIDLCPVGALTSRDFRFKARVWEMSSTDTICVGCARGCNTKMWVRNNEILRLTPRLNPDVNEYWMCDHGRLETFKSVNSDNHIKAPMIRKEGELVEVGWDEAIAKVAMELKTYKKHELAGVGSAFAANEDNYLFVKLMYYLGIKKFDYKRHIIEDDQDELLIRADKTPNSTGTREVGVVPKDGSSDFSAIIAGINNGTIKALYVMDDNIAADRAVADALLKLDFLVVHAANENETTKLADVVLSSSTYAEKNGTMTNFQGRVQRIRPAITTAEQDRALDGFAMSRLDKFGAHNDRWMNGPRHDARPSWRILLGVANALGAKWKYATVDDVFNEIASTIESFKGMSYLRLGLRGMMLKRTTEAVPAGKR